jgi:hypothetical protein
MIRNIRAKLLAKSDSKLSGDQLKHIFDNFPKPKARNDKRHQKQSPYPS